MLALIQLTGTSCGYKLIDYSEPIAGLGSVVVQTFKNESYEPGVEFVVADALRREFLRRGAVVLVDDAIGEVRGLGLMVGVDLRKKVTPVLRRLMDRGIWALPAGINVLRLLPPLTIPESELHDALSAVVEVLGDA